MRGSSCGRSCSSGRRGPRILDYSGRGQLRFWFRVTVLRTLLDELRAEKRKRRGAERRHRAGRAVGGSDPEIEHLKKVYRNEVGAAFEDTVSALSPEDRNVLRSYYARQMTIDEIGAGVRHPPRDRGAAGERRARAAARARRGGG